MSDLVPRERTKNEAPARTSADSIRLDLARRIVTAELLPGTPLDESRLAEQFQVSRTPVREALRQLASSGLVEQRPHKKAIVTKPGKEALSDMFAVMGYLEALCAGLCALAMSANQRQALEKLHDEMGGMVRAGDGPGYTQANEDFHNAIYEGTQNAYLAEITFSTRTRLQPFRRAQFDTLGRLAASHAEHSTIIEAIQRGDRVSASNAMREHIGLVEDAWHRFAGDVQPLAATKAFQDP